MKALFITIIAVMSFNSFASIVCHTPRSNKIFEIKDSKVTFYNEFDKAAKREIASVVARSKSTDKGVTKFVNFENQKHTIHIGDVSHFSDIDDYIVIRAKSGHEMTYPLNCQNK